MKKLLSLAILLASASIAHSEESGASYYEKYAKQPVEVMLVDASGKQTGPYALSDIRTRKQGTEIYVVLDEKEGSGQIELVYKKR